eukprot:g62187.t1
MFCVLLHCGFLEKTTFSCRRLKKILEPFPPSVLKFFEIYQNLSNQIHTDAAASMVEGHSVHRVAHQHKEKMVGKAYAATSPNGRFADGAAAIDQQQFRDIKAVGKNLFCFFGEHHVVHAPPVKSTTRLVLKGHGLEAHLSAMTVTAKKNPSFLFPLNEAFLVCLIYKH